MNRTLTAINLKALGKNLIDGPDGILTTASHQDVEFAYQEVTDWHAIETTSFWYRHRNRCFLALLDRFKPRGPIFEIGAGNGNVALGLQSAGWPVVAVEPTVRSAATARQRGVEQVICARIEEAGFAPNSLANVGLFDVLEHIADDERFIKEIGGLMSPGGFFYCAVPAGKALWSSEDEAAGHYRRYSRAQLVRLFASAGFQVEYASYFFAPLVLPILLLRALPTALRLRTARTDQATQREHALPRGVAGHLLENILIRESRQMRAGKRKLLGASCLLVARAC